MDPGQIRNRVGPVGQPVTGTIGVQAGNGGACLTRSDDVTPAMAREDHAPAVGSGAWVSRAGRNSFRYTRRISYALLKDEVKGRAYESQHKLKFTLKRKRQDEVKKEILERWILILRRKEEEQRLRKQREEEEERLRKQREEEERLRDDIERIEGEMAAIGMRNTSELFPRMLIISDARGYTCAQLTELFRRYVVVKFVKIIEKIGSALLEMATKDGAAAALADPPLPGVSSV